MNSKNFVSLIVVGIILFASCTKSKIENTNTSFASQKMVNIECNGSFLTPWRININAADVYAPVSEHNLPFYPQSFQYNEGKGVPAGLKVAVDATGNIYTMGYYHNAYGLFDFDAGQNTAYLPATPYSGIYLQKVDLEGNFLWVKKLNVGKYSGAMYPSYPANMTLVLDNNGGIYVSGYKAEESGIFDYKYNTITKLDESGNILWSKSLYSPDAKLRVYSLSADGNGNIYYSGSVFGDVDFDPGDGVYKTNAKNHYFVLKLNSSGEFQRLTTIGESGSGNGTSKCIADAAGNFYLFGKFVGTLNFGGAVGTITLTSDNTFVAKYDTDGNAIWVTQLTIPNAGFHTNEYSDITLDQSENVFVNMKYYLQPSADYTVGNSSLAGYYNSLYAHDCVAKFDNTGQIEWIRNVNGFNHTIQVDAGGSLYTCGDTYEGYRTVINKISSSGNLLWTNDTYNAISNSMATGGITGTFYLTGSFINSELNQINPFTAKLADCR